MISECSAALADCSSEADDCSSEAGDGLMCWQDVRQARLYPKHSKEDRLVFGKNGLSLINSIQ